MKLNPSLLAIISISITLIYISILLSVEHTGGGIIGFWIPMLLIINVYIGSPIIIFIILFRRTDSKGRRVFVKNMLIFSLVLFLMTFVFMNVAGYILPPTSFGSGWGILAMWFLTIFGLMFFGALVLLAMLGDRLISPENKKVSSVIYIILCIPLIHSAFLLLMYTLQEF